MTAEEVDPTAESDLAGPAHRWSEPRRGRLELGYALAALLFVAAVSIYRLGAVKDAVYPGHADPAFYFNVAQNARAGHGPTINYQWEFLSGQHGLPQYAFGYWLPLTSVLMSIALHFGSTLAAALAMNIAMSILLCAGVYLLARELATAVWVPALAAAVVDVQPSISRFSVQSEAAIYLAAFGMLAVAAAVKAHRWPWLWPVVGVLTGLANLARSEGLVLFALVLIAAVASGRRRAESLVRGASVAAGYVVVMSPLFWEDLRHYGTLLPPASGSFPYITSYENLFALHIQHSLSALFHEFFRLRALTLEQQFSAAYSAADAVAVALILTLIGAGLVRTQRDLRDRPRWPIRASDWVLRVARHPWFVPGGFVVVTFLFYALVSPVVAGAGAVDKGMATILPILIVAALVTLPRVGFPRAVLVLIAIVLAGGPLLNLATITRGVIKANNRIGQSQLPFGRAMAAEATCLTKRPVLMTRNPWEFTQVTGYRSVMIPNNALPDILTTAQRYGVTDIQATLSRKALAHLADLVRSGVLSQPPSLHATNIYRIVAASPDARC